MFINIFKSQISKHINKKQLNEIEKNTQLSLKYIIETFINDIENTIIDLLNLLKNYKKFNNNIENLFYIAHSIKGEAEQFGFIKIYNIALIIQNSNIQYIEKYIKKLDKEKIWINKNMNKIIKYCDIK